MIDINKNRIGGELMCQHNRVVYGEITQDPYEMRSSQECVCLDCGMQLEATVRNGKANYWWESYNEFFDIRKGNQSK